MFKVNENFLRLKESYLFSDISKRVRLFKEDNPDADIIRLGIGDVTLPLPEVVVQAMIDASKEMGERETFRGYGDEQGYGFLRQAIKDYYMDISNVSLKLEEIFISDGAKSDIANFTDLFSNENSILIPDPVYPVYLDSNLMLGRSVSFIEGNEENYFLPMPSKSLKADIIYLCSPNNPTGSVYNYQQLEDWIKYAIENQSVIFFDSAYEAFVSDAKLPRSIYEIDGANKCAVEFCSLSKTAGFTGTRCGYTIVPKDLVFEMTSINKMWLRRQTTKFNGTSYIVQRGAEAVFSKKGIVQCQNNIKYYMRNAQLISKVLNELKIWHTGGINSPYIWLKCNMDSWSFFQDLLENVNVVGTPGSGFGKCGEGFFRLTAFNTYEKTFEAMLRLKNYFLR